MKRLFLIAVLVAACSSGSGSGGDPVKAEAFLGKWSVGGNANVTFSQTQPYSGTVPSTQYNIVFSAGGSKDLVSIDSTGCKLEWTLTSKGIKLEAPQVCTVTSGMPLTINVQTSSLEITPVTSVQLSIGGSVSGTCGMSACNADAAGQFTKVP